MRQERGFTLIEVVFALGLFGLLSLSMASSFLFYKRVNTENEFRSGAIAAAQDVLDGLRTEDPALMPRTLGAKNPETRKVVVSGRRDPFEVTITYCEAQEYCISEDVRHIKVAVSYRGEVRYETETVYTQLR